MSRQADIKPHHRDAFDHEDQPEPGWTAGDVQFDDEPPSRELEADPGQRKWMLLGVGICGLITAAVVVSLNIGAPQDNTAKRLELPPTASASAPAIPPVVAAEPEPAAAVLAEDHTLASLAAAVDAPDLRTFRAPPPPPPLVEQPVAPPEPSANVVHPKPAPVVVPAPKPAVEPVPPPPSPDVKPKLGPLPSIEDDDQVPLAPPPVPDVERSDPGGLIDVSSDELPTVG